MNKNLRPESYLKIIGGMIYQILKSGLRKSSMRIAKDQIKEIKGKLSEFGGKE